MSNYIASLKINHFRNLASIDINTTPKFNIFYGENGSGKTSVLEAIHYLGLGKSFRTHVADRIVQYGEDAFSIILNTLADSEPSLIGLERSLSNGKKIRMNGETLNSLSQVAKILPLQLIRTDSYRYFHDGPKVRRQFLDWGLFHVKQSFLSQWRQLQNATQQRNAGLKARAPQSEIQAWDPEIARIGEEIHQWREKYVEQLQPILNNALKYLLNSEELQLVYQKGWNSDYSLEHALRKSYYRDSQLGYTQTGPHRADLQLYYNKTPVDDYLSQGQQKLAAYALYLAQGQLMKQLTDSSPIYLIDDLPSELDPLKRQQITRLLADIDAQVFINGITKGELEDIIRIEGSNLFHVEHGDIKHEAISVIA